MLNKLALNRLVLVLNQVSLIAASTVVVGALIVATQNRKLIDRTSFRLQLGIAITDVARHLLQLYNHQIDSGTCAVVGFLVHLNDLFYVMLNFFLVLNTQLLLLHGIVPNLRWEKLFWLITFLFPVLITLPPFLMDAFGHTTEGYCAINHSFTHYFLLTRTIKICALVPLSYALLILTLILAKIVLWREAFIAIRVYIREHPTRSVPNIRGRFFLLVLGSLVLDNLLWQTVLKSSSSGAISLDSVGWDRIGRSVSGSLNLVAMMCCPTPYRAAATLLRGPTTCPTLTQWRDDETRAQFAAVTTSSQPPIYPGLSTIHDRLNNNYPLPPSLALDPPPSSPKFTPRWA